MPGFNDDDTKPEGPQHGVPLEPLDLDAPAVPVDDLPETVRVRPARPSLSRSSGVDVDALFAIYDRGLRAWGRMTMVTGTPPELEADIVGGVGQLGAFLRTLGAKKSPKTPEQEQQVAAVALKIRLAVDKFEIWLARHRQP